MNLFPNSIPLSINLIPNSGTLVRRNNFNKKIFFKYPFCKHEDFIFYIKLLNFAKCIALIEKPLIAYNVNRKTLTGNKLVSKIWHARAISKVKKISFFRSITITLFGIFITLPIIFFLGKLRIVLNKKKYKNISFHFKR